MPRTIQKTVFTLQELLDLQEKGQVTARAVERAREWLVQGQTDHDWWEYIYDLWNKALDQIGFTDADIHFSGFWSQGDGASFTSGVDLQKLATFLGTPFEPSDTIPASSDPGGEDFRGWIVKQISGKTTNLRYRRLASAMNYIDAQVKRTTSHYVHENTCEFQADLRDMGELGAGPDYKWISNQPRLRAMFDEFVQDAEALRVDLCRAIYASLEQEYEYLTSDETLAEMSNANEYFFDRYGHRDG